MSTDIKRLLQCLQEVKSNTYTTSALAHLSNAKTEKILSLIFQIGTEKTKFTVEESRLAGARLPEIIEHIKINIERAGCLHRTRLDTSILRKRSALQFLVDDYGSFPSGGTTLSNVLTQSNIGETIKILDEIIDQWHDVSDSDEATTDRDTSEIPPSHYWWNQ